MFTITTRYMTTPTTGSSRIVAKGYGKQKTITFDDSKSFDYNHGAAAGALLSVVLSDEQKAKLRHPSGIRRLTHEAHDNARHTFTVNV
jgi:hypothetical protein